MRKLLVAAVSAAIVFLPAAAARSATATVTAAAFTYLPPAVPIQQGDSLDFTNNDIQPHDITSDTAGQFQSAVVGNGATTRVSGVESLSPGQYTFHCSIHPFMHGTIAVAASTPAPAPPPLPTPSPGVGAVPTGPVVPTPTSLTVFGDPPAVYAASYAQGAVYKLPVLAGGLLGPGTPYATGFSNPLGVAFDPTDGTMFVADSHASATAGRSTDGRVWAVPPGGGTPQVVVDGLPNGRHNTNGMAVRNGLLYITNGSSTDDGVNGGDPEVPPLGGA